MPASPETSFYLGFDVSRWASEGLVDTVIPSPRFSSSDTDMPVELWKRLLAPYGTEIAAGVEIIIKEQPAAANTFNTVETVTAAAASYFSAGADKLYLFNYFHLPRTDASDRNTEDGVSHHPLDDCNYIAFLSAAGSKEASLSHPRSHLITYRGSDALSFWESTNAQLPKHVPHGSWAMFRIRTGEVLPGSRVSLLIGFAPDRLFEMTVFLNTVPLAFKGRFAGPCEFTGLPLYEFVPPDSGTLSPVNTVELSPSEDTNIGYIELRIN